MSGEMKIDRNYRKILRLYNHNHPSHSIILDCNRESHDCIVIYIINNPALWKKDKHYPLCPASQSMI
jgi:hypothetical protein